MSLLVVVYFLILGYIGVSSRPTKKNELRRSAGWEAYVYLAYNGIGVFLSGLIIYLLMCAITWLVSLPIEWILSFFLQSGFSIFSQVKSFIFNIELFRGNTNYIHVLFITIFSWIRCEGLKSRTPSLDDYKALKGLDGVLNIVVHAMHSNSFVKVSLKSRKIYIGLVVSEQFDNVDLDNIIIIPFLSGYRDKDTLNMVTNCNYMPMYEKNNFLDKDYKIDSNKVHDLKMLIRVNEIETISMFNPEYYQDFSIDNDMSPSDIKSI